MIKIRDINGAYIKMLKEEFPHLEINDLQGYGANIRIQSRVVTVYWGKRKYCDSTNQDWVHYRDIAEFIEIIKQIESAQPNTKKRSEPTVITTAPQVTNGVQQCIDHIRDKRNRVEKTIKPNFAIITMLDNLALELEQYL